MTFTFFFSFFFYMWNRNSWNYCRWWGNAMTSWKGSRWLKLSVWRDELSRKHPHRVCTCDRLLCCQTEQDSFILKGCMKSLNDPVMLKVSCVSLSPEWPRPLLLLLKLLQMWCVLMGILVFGSGQRLKLGLWVGGGNAHSGLLQHVPQQDRRGSLWVSPHSCCPHLETLW